jgi:hypothetical protein
MLRTYLRNRYGPPFQQRMLHALGEQFMYGHFEIFKQYLSLGNSEILKAVIPHAGNCEIEIAGQVNRQLDWKGEPLIQLLWDKKSQIDGERRGIDNLYTIGAPYLYYLVNKGGRPDEIKGNFRLIAENWCWGDDPKAQIESIESKKILILPKHSWQGDLQVRNSQFSKLIELRKRTESLAFCLGYLDYLDPRKHTFYGKELGIEIFCAGISSTEIPYSQIPARINFYENLTNIFMKFDLIVGEEFTTGLWYASCLGKQTGILNQELIDNIEYTNSYWTNSRKHREMDINYRKRYSYLSSNDFDPIERYNKLVDDVGIEYIRNAEEILSMVPVLQFENKFND